MCFLARAYLLAYGRMLLLRCCRQTCITKLVAVGLLAFVWLIAGRSWLNHAFVAAGLLFCCKRWPIVLV
ncbi:unnamed protein product [Lathyrus oleraceus]